MSARQKHRKNACGRLGCGGTVSLETDGNGKVITCCTGCERLSRGVCQDCPSRIVQPVTGRRRWRCERCATKRNHRMTMAYMRDYFVGYRSREKHKLYWRAYWQRPDVKARAQKRYERDKLAILRRQKRVA